MNKKPRSLTRIIIPVVLTLVTIALIVWPMLAGGQYVVLDPKGPIGASQRFDCYFDNSLCDRYRACVDFVCCNRMALPRQAGQ